MNEKEKMIWAAGLFDGEGYIGVEKRNIGRDAEKSIKYQLTLSMQMVHKPTIIRFAEIVGEGNIRKAVRKGENHRNLWFWTASHKKGYNVLLKLMDYVYTKKDQFECAKSFYENCIIKAHFPYKLGVPKEELEKREKYHLKIKELKWGDFYD